MADENELMPVGEIVQNTEEVLGSSQGADEDSGIQMNHMGVSVPKMRAFLTALGDDIEATTPLGAKMFVSETALPVTGVADLEQLVIEVLLPRTPRGAAMIQDHIDKVVAAERQARELSNQDVVRTVERSVPQIITPGQTGVIGPNQLYTGELAR